VGPATGAIAALAVALREIPRQLGALAARLGWQSHNAPRRPGTWPGGTGAKRPPKIGYGLVCVVDFRVSVFTVTSCLTTVVSLTRLLVVEVSVVSPCSVLPDVHAPRPKSAPAASAAKGEHRLHSILFGM